jgi:hypothetical protein
MDWQLPTLAGLYTEVLDQLKGRDLDAATLHKDPSGNTPTGAIKLDRATLKLQEWMGAAWEDRPLSVAGGGTGSSSAAGARNNLGLGTIAVQNSNGVNISGGTIGGITQLALNGPVTFSTDDTVVIGTNGNRAGRIYIRSGLVVPVGADKFVTS